MQILIRMQNGEGFRLTRDGTTRVSAIKKEAIKWLGKKGKFTLRSSEGILNPNATIARAGGKDPEWVERVWKLEPVAKKAAVRRKR